MAKNFVEELKWRGMLAQIMPGTEEYLVQLKDEENHIDHTYLWDIMNQFTTMETGAGVLSPAWYYNSLHKNYQRDANLRNKLAYRTDVMANTSKEVNEAEKVDSDYVERAKVEALNIVSRSSASDLSWVLEKKKLDSKMLLFDKNINHIVSCGGSSSDYRNWRNIYNCFETAIKITHESYQDLGMRKREYLAIYQDIVKRNVTLVKQLLYWNSMKKGKRFSENNTRVERNTSNTVIASDAYRRWQAAMAVDGFSGSKP